MYILTRLGLFDILRLGDTQSLEQLAGALKVRALQGRVHGSDSRCVASEMGPHRCKDRAAGSGTHVWALKERVCLYLVLPAALQVDKQILRRLLRFASQIGLVKEHQGAEYSVTEMGAVLAHDHPICGVVITW
jgi:hypothetical protein